MAGKKKQKQPPKGDCKGSVVEHRGFDFGHREALLALHAAQVTPGLEIPGRAKASPALLLFRPPTPFI